MSYNFEREVKYFLEEEYNEETVRDNYDCSLDEFPNPILELDEFEPVVKIKEILFKLGFDFMSWEIKREQCEYIEVYVSEDKYLKVTYNYYFGFTEIERNLKYER
jgi:hypothetical protein